MRGRNAAGHVGYNPELDDRRRNATSGSRHAEEKRDSYDRDGMRRDSQQQIVDQVILRQAEIARSENTAEEVVAVSPPENERGGCRDDVEYPNRAWMQVPKCPRAHE